MEKKTNTIDYLYSIIRELGQLEMTLKGIRDTTIDFLIREQITEPYNPNPTPTITDNDSSAGKDKW